MNCSYCGSNQVRTEHDKGQIVCENCGIVIESTIVDMSQEWRAYDKEDKLKKGRVGAPLTAGVHDNGLSTIISTNDFKINRDKIEQRIKSIRLAKVQKKSRVSTSDRPLVTALSELSRMVARLSLPHVVGETAAILVKRMIKEGIFKPSKAQELLATAIYMACKRNRIAKSVQEISKQLGVDKRKIWRAYSILTKKGLNDSSIINPTQYLPKIINELGLPEYIIPKASKMVEEVFEGGLVSGKGHLSLSVATIYLLGALLDMKITQKQMAERTGVTEVTLRSRYRELVDFFEVEVGM